MNTPPPQTSDTPRADRAYEQIRDLLITLGIAPGAIIREDSLAQELGFGRAVIRDALKRCERDRLVVVYPRRGTFATELQIDDGRWLTEVRSPLEGLAAGLAAGRCNARDRAQLAEFEQQRDSLDGKRANIDWDVQVHRAIYRITRNPHLEATLDEYLNLAMRLWNHFWDVVPDLQRHNAEQGNVVRAIIDGDEKKAEDAASQHILTFWEHMRSNL